MNNLINRWRALWNPNRYHGWGRDDSYFEGWYFKMVSADESLAIALIPGISMDSEGKKHAFIQMIDGTKGKTFYTDFPAEHFIADSKRFHVNVGDNSFNEESININLNEIQGEIKFEKATLWPKQLGAPGIMGWYSFVPFMQCYHGVVSLHHKLNGHLFYNDEKVDFTGGIGYIEKDWGASFPKCWIWMQSNHFNDLSRKVSIMASVAHIPWMTKYFVGFLVGFWLDDHLIQFTTYNGSKMVSSLEGDQVFLSFIKRKYTLKIKATKGSTGELISPIVGEMAGKVNESLQATIEIQLLVKNSIVYEGVGRNAGLEVAGDVNVLMTEFSKS